MVMVDIVNFNIYHSYLSKKKLQCVTIVPKWKKLNPRHKWHMIVKKVWNARKCGENHILMQSEDEMLLNCLYW